MPKNCQPFFQIYQQLQNHMNPYLAIYQMAIFFNHNCSSTAKQVAYMMKDRKRRS